MNSANNNSSPNDRVNEDAAKSLQNILNSVRTSVENEFAIQQMEYEELYGVDSPEYEQYQNKVGSWLKSNKLIDLVADLLPISLMMDMASPHYQEESPPPQITLPGQPVTAQQVTSSSAVAAAPAPQPVESQNPWGAPVEEAAPMPEPAPVQAQIPESHSSASACGESESLGGSS